MLVFAKTKNQITQLKQIYANVEYSDVFLSSLRSRGPNKTTTFNNGEDTRSFVFTSHIPAGKP